MNATDKFILEVISVTDVTEDVNKYRHKCGMSDSPEPVVDVRMKVDDYGVVEEMTRRWKQSDFETYKEAGQFTD